MSAFIELMACGGGTVFLSTSDIVGVRTTGDSGGLASPQHPLRILLRGAARDVEVFGVSAEDVLFKLYTARAEYLDARDLGKPFVFKTYFLDGHE